MYILFANDTPLEVHTDLDHLVKRKEFFENSNQKMIETNPHLDFNPVEYSIGDVLEWEKVLLDHYFGVEPEEQDISKCPQCGGSADNGFNREVPPCPYLCTECDPEE